MRFHTPAGFAFALMTITAASLAPQRLPAQTDTGQPSSQIREAPAQAAPAHLQFPPWAEVDTVCPTDPPTAEYDFEAHLTALPRIRQETFGPSNGLCCLLNDGIESYVPTADFIVHNPRGADMVFKRSFRSDRALAGYGSPGLSLGWVHGYDVIITAQHGAAPWSPMVITYPNGQVSGIKPLLDATGLPTGQMQSSNGAPYAASGVPLDAQGHWKTITLTWQGNAKWLFIPLNDDTYVLKQVGNIGIGWDKDRRLLGTYDAENNTVLMTLAYDANGLLSAVTDAEGRKRTYAFNVPPGSGLKSASLVAMSQLVDVNAQNIPMQAAYTYTAYKGKPLLHTVSVPSPTGNGMSTATLEFNEGKLIAHIDANGNQHVYTYGPTGTLVQIKDATGKIVSFWTQNIDARGRNTGITDANGQSVKISYP
jgi:YD repeat-containing protein